MAETFNCEQCGSLMQLEQRLQNTKPKKGSPHGHRVRRFKCSNAGCDHKETVFADGFRDKVLEKYRADIEVKKMYKQEEDSRL